MSEDTKINGTEPVKCSACNEALVSDIEDDDEKNIGCDECPRWYHMKCTEFCEIFACS